jgi:hypothetical protein
MVWVERKDNCAPGHDAAEQTGTATRGRQGDARHRIESLDALDRQSERSAGQTKQENGPCRQSVTEQRCHVQNGHHTSTYRQRSRPALDGCCETLQVLEVDDGDEAPSGKEVRLISLSEAQIAAHTDRLLRGRDAGRARTFVRSRGHCERAHGHALTRGEERA